MLIVVKIVINRCFGGFSLSPEATLEVWRRGGKIEATPVAEYYGHTPDSVVFGKNSDLKKWREYLAGSKMCSFLTVFSPDESLVLGTRPDDRTDPILVQVVEQMGKASGGSCSELKIVEVPDDASWAIEEYDGMESIHETHRSWG